MSTEIRMDDRGAPDIAVAERPVLLQKWHSLYGLSIFETPDAMANPVAQVTWSREVVPSLPSGKPTVGQFLRESEPWTEHAFASGGTTYCIMAVSPDGRHVRSRAIPEMLSANVEELFFETVMRTVLCRLGAPSFHAAALARDGRALLLMGNKGAGKSTLAAALQQVGWTLLADDLVRLQKFGDRWMAFPGMRRNKLRPDSLRALGYSAEGAQLRWQGALPPQENALQEEKLLLPSMQGAVPSKAVTVAAAFCLHPRRDDLHEAAATELDLRSAILHLSQHLTRDPLSPQGAPPAAFGQVLGELASQASVFQLQLPADLSRVQAAATQCTALLD